jgi:hypothetical protein
MHWSLWYKYGDFNLIFWNIASLGHLKKRFLCRCCWPFFPKQWKKLFGKKFTTEKKKEKKSSVCNNLTTPWWAGKQTNTRSLIKINLISCVTNLYNWLAKHIMFYNTNVFRYTSNVLFCFHCRSWRWVGSMRQVGWNLHLIFWGKYVWGRFWHNRL